MWNGEADGSNRITLARVYVNGEKIFCSQDFKTQVFVMDATFDLEENNDLFVQLWSKPGSHLTIRVTREAALRRSP